MRLIRWWFTTAARHSVPNCNFVSRYTHHTHWGIVVNISKEATFSGAYVDRAKTVFALRSPVFYKYQRWIEFLLCKQINQIFNLTAACFDSDSCVYWQLLDYLLCLHYHLWEKKKKQSLIKIIMSTTTKLKLNLDLI